MAGTFSILAIVIAITILAGYFGYYRPVTRKAAQLNTDAVQRFAAFGFDHAEAYGRTYSFGTYMEVPMMATWQFVQEGVSLEPYVTLSAVVSGTSEMRLHAATELHGVGPSAGWAEAGDFMVSKGYKMDPEAEAQYLAQLTETTRAFLLEKNTFSRGIAMLTNGIGLMFGEDVARTVAGEADAGAIVAQQTLPLSITDAELETALKNLAKAAAMMAKDWE